jgi:hypothetical protein
MNTIWLVTTPAFKKGGLVLQGCFSTAELAYEYADRLAIDEVAVDAHPIDNPPIHRTLSHYKPGRIPKAAGPPQGDPT